MPKGYPDYYYPTLIERGISDVRGISPLGYTQFKLYYGWASESIMAEKPFHARAPVSTTYSPPETYVWYDDLTGWIFRITSRLEMVLLGLYTHSCTIEGYVEATNQCIVLEPYFQFRVNEEVKFTVVCYRNVWTETTPTLKRHAGDYNITEPIYIYEGDVIDIRTGFRYMATVAGTVFNLRPVHNLLEEDSFIQLPIKAIKPVE